jgi:solute carrier family 35 (UDP-sugar transporter), member A1/2/3
VIQIVAVVVKYADNVMKGFATSLSILISCLFSSYLFHDVDMNSAFATGACVVLASVFAFGYQPSSVSNSITGLSKTLST